MFALLPNILAHYRAIDLEFGLVGSSWSSVGILTKSYISLIPKSGENGGLPTNKPMQCSLQARFEGTSKQDEGIFE